jgi:hypothetical protein
LVSNGVVSSVEELRDIAVKFFINKDNTTTRIDNDSFSKFVKHVLEKKIVEPQFTQIFQIMPENIGNLIGKDNISFKELTEQVKGRVTAIFVNQFLEAPIIIKDDQNNFTDKSLLRLDEFNHLEYTFANQSVPTMNYTNIKELIMYLMLAQNQGNVGILSEKGSNYILFYKRYIEIFAIPYK